jgi:hypothetical protein
LLMGWALYSGCSCNRLGTTGDRWNLTCNIDSMALTSHADG